MPEEQRDANGEDWLRYGLALEASEEGFWDWDLVAERLWGSSRWQSLTGARGACSKLETWMERVHPQDRPRLEGELRAAREGQACSISNEHRVRDGAGRWRWVTLRGRVARGADGRVTHVAGSLNRHNGVPDDRCADRHAEPGVLCGPPGAADRAGFSACGLEFCGRGAGTGPVCAGE